MSKQTPTKKALQIVCFVACLFGAFGPLLPTHHAYGQDSQQDPSVSSEPSRWAVGIQAFPVPGVSVRRALTPRLAVQIAGVPGFGDRVSWFRGGAGGRLLYRFKVAEAGDLYVSGAYTLLRTERDGVTLASGQHSPNRIESRLHYGALTVGAELPFGRGMNLSLELGGARVLRDDLDGEPVWREDIDGRSLLTGGVGLHYRW